MLRDIAFHRLRLDANWARDCPLPKGSVTSFRTKGHRVVAVVPATDIIILYSSNLTRDRADGKLFCYDTKTTEETFELDLPAGPLIYAKSVPLQAKGEYRIALQMQSYVVVIHSHFL
jgi:hypothetical protein